MADEYEYVTVAVERGARRGLTSWPTLPEALRDRRASEIEVYLNRTPAFIYTSTEVVAMRRELGIP